MTSPPPPPLPARLAPKLRQLVQPGGDARRIPIARLRDSLGLVDIPHAGFLGDGCWLVGGSLLRWVCGELGGDKNPGDFDLFFASRGALARTAGQLFRAGYAFHRYSIKGTPLDKMRKRIWPPLPDMTGWDGARMEAFFAQVAALPNLIAMDFHAPNGDVIQLAGVATRSSPAEIHASADYTVCQFVSDGAYVYVGAHTWDDLLAGRLRANRLGYPPIAARRMIKYWRRGFRPYPATVRQVVGAVLRGRWRWPS